MEPPQDEVEVNLGAALGAEVGTSTQRLTLYLPNKDRENREIADQAAWVNRARQLLTEINGGATALPPADGTWRTDEGNVLWEQTRLVYSYVRPDAFLAQLGRLRQFLHQFGRETNQGEVVFEFDGQFFRVRHFDPA
jgi:hypothetical protein